MRSQRLFRRLLLAAVLSLAGTALSAQSLGSRERPSAEVQQLLRATNQDRAQHGLGPLRWDQALARAAQAHVALMVRQGQISHQYTGEPDLVARTGLAGAHFQVVAENLAIAAAPQFVEAEWMHSPPHRRNILDPRLNAVGIGLIRRGDRLWAVEDFAASIVLVDSSEAERRIGRLLVERGLQPSGSVAAARQTCAMDHGFAHGPGGSVRPGFIMRWQGADLNRLPQQLDERISTRRFHTAAVGVCNAGETSQGFTSYRVAVLLF